MSVWVQHQVKLSLNLHISIRLHPSSTGSQGMTRMVQRLGVNDFGDLDLHKEGPLPLGWWSSWPDEPRPWVPC